MQRVLQDFLKAPCSSVVPGAAVPFLKLLVRGSTVGAGARRMPRGCLLSPQRKSLTSISFLVSIDPLHASRVNFQGLLGTYQRLLSLLNGHTQCSHGQTQPHHWEGKVWLEWPNLHPVFPVPAAMAAFHEQDLRVVPPSGPNLNRRRTE